MCIRYFMKWYELSLAYIRFGVTADGEHCVCACRLQQNNAEEDLRTGHKPSAAELAERQTVSQKSLFCAIKPEKQQK